MMGFIASGKLLYSGFIYQLLSPGIRYTVDSKVQKIQSSTNRKANCLGVTSDNAGAWVTIAFSLTTFITILCNPGPFLFRVFCQSDRWDKTWLSLPEMILLPLSWVEPRSQLCSPGHGGMSTVNTPQTSHLYRCQERCYPHIGDTCSASTLPYQYTYTNV